MEVKNYYTAVGFFAISILLLSFYSIYWLSRNDQYNGPTTELIIRIPGSVEGLAVNSSVRFNGIPIGHVTGLFVDKDNPHYSMAQTLVRVDVPLYPSTKAMIKAQGITGMTYIELSTERTENYTLFQTATKEKKIAMITAIPSGINHLLSTAEDTLNKINVSSDQIQKIINNADNPLNRIIKNFETISTILVDNVSDLDKMIHRKNNVAVDFTKTLSNTSDFITSLNKTIKAVDIQKINQIIENIQVVSNNFIKSSDQVTNTINDLQETTHTFQGVGKKADHLLSDVSSQIHSKEAFDFWENISESSSNIRNSTSAIREITDHSQKIILTIDTIEKMTENLNNSSIKLKELMTTINSFTDSEGKKSLIEDAQKAIRSFQNTTEKINEYIPPIAKNLQNFSNSGLYDLQNLIRNLQETVGHFDDSLSNFERNPQNIIWGKETVKQYKPKH
ncbi:putative ABC transporter, substrate-binding protein [Candidatus Liberibacter solanacearum CLso-ZC1]|uniref:Putative ABC transporter, substrate-binding protein n=1 Tax=Liberibacter solanacearum (strain CLso-ZC1) TaxID=658172 RepID=E4UDR5_LIBSC|nr:MlaD family protein [Candidatus Liberibacter solanacearum]ADR52743.1 putative ABC transporter, substrate-binding protein [Candidatus Liberibacter solanacearum CLso-ZC1]